MLGENYRKVYKIFSANSVKRTAKDSEVNYIQRSKVYYKVNY